MLFISDQRKTNRLYFMPTRACMTLISNPCTANHLSRFHIIDYTKCARVGDLISTQNQSLVCVPYHMERARVADLIYLYKTSH
jgi:hypothetical protein